jgi:GH15 family glucan-1,4-alpha-glucosidase
MDHADRPPLTGQSPSAPLADYTIIGDCSTCAVVGRNGSIDWLCWPRFDSPACFSALLGDSPNGRWLIAPSDFLPHDDPRVRGTVDAIQRELVSDGFVMRYRTEAGADGLPPGEGVFLACSFWLADCPHKQGRIDEARELLERLLALRNDLGLLSEEYDPRSKRLLGNFPQAFSLALISAAMNLSAVQRATAEQRTRVGIST